jgi:prephenate dehydrogenase
MKKLSIIGYGQFTRLMIKHMQNDFDILVYSRNPADKKKDDLRFSFVTLEQALAQKFIILGMPAQFFEEFLRANSANINPDALVLDVASVKQKPLEDMAKHLPEGCQIIGTHPIFGPGSAKHGINGLRIVLCPLRCRPATLNSLRTYLEHKALIVLEKSPQEHDKAMAYVLGLSQYIGRALKAIDAHDTELTTPAYEDLMEIRRIQGNDSWDLFYSIMSLNPYAEEVMRQLRAAFDMLDKQLADESGRVA